MSAIGDLVATMGMNVNPFQRAVSGAQQHLQQVAGNMSATLGKVRGAMGSVMSGLGMGVGIGAVLAGGQGLMSFFMGAIDGASTAAREQKRLGVILESTGASANISAGQIGDYASELMKTTSFDDDAIVGAASALAPFASRMSGEMFKGTLKSAADVTSVMGGDISQAAAKIGMAMQNPERAMKMMRSWGVQFSETQQQQLKNYKDQGDAAGAQAVILSAINAKFAGDAEKMASPMAQLKNQFEDIQKTIGAAVLPYVKMFASAFLTAVQTIVAWIGQFGSNFGDVIATLSEAWSVFTAFIGEVWSGAIEYLFGSSDGLSSMWSSTVAFMADLIHGLAFTFRNFGSLAKLSLINVVLSALEYFPQMEGPITAAASVFVASWAFVKTFFSTIVANIIGGLKEIWNVFKAVGAGISAAWSAMMSGDFSGIGSAFGDSFMKEFTSQVDVKAPNAFAEATKAAGEASGQFQQNVASKGGMSNYLKDQQKAIQDEIGKNEVAFEQRRQKARIEAQKPPEQAGKSTPPDIGKKSGKAAKEEQAKALDFSSDEAWKSIVSSMTGGTNKDKAAIDTAANTARAADALEELAGRDPDEADFAS